MTLRLLGVLRSGHRLPNGIGVRLVVWHDLAAVVSDSPGDALADLEVLCALVRYGPVVPLRFGTVARDEEAVRSDVLAAAADRLRAHLDRLDGLVEVHVHLDFDEETALAAVLDSSTLHIGHDRVAAGERIAQAVAAWCRHRADGLLMPVTPLARQEALLSGGEPTSQRRALLIPLTDAGRVSQVVAALACSEVAARLAGPLPAYNFLDVVAEPPASRWGW